MSRTSADQRRGREQHSVNAGIGRIIMGRAPWVIAPRQSRAPREERGLLVLAAGKSARQRINSARSRMTAGECRSATTVRPFQSPLLPPFTWQVNAVAPPRFLADPGAPDWRAGGAAPESTRKPRRLQPTARRRRPASSRARRVRSAARPRARAEACAGAVAPPRPIWTARPGRPAKIGATLRYLPKYSCDLNPIEMALQQIQGILAQGGRAHGLPSPQGHSLLPAAAER